MTEKVEVEATLLLDKADETIKKEQQREGRHTTAVWKSNKDGEVFIFKYTRNQ